MEKTYHWRLRVRTYETDRMGQVQDGFYINYLQEAATEASASLGYSLAWYLAHDRLWLLRTLTIHYFQPAQSGDELDISTWISDIKRIRSHREYAIHRAQTPILRAQANWVFVDTLTMQPTRIPAEFDAAIEAEQPAFPVLDFDGTPLENAPRFVHERIAQHYEIDMAGHVNNGVYPRWVEQATQQAFDQIGWGGTMILRGRELEYFKPAQERDPIRITSWVQALQENLLIWTHEIHHAESGELLVRDRCIRSASEPIPLKLLRVKNEEC